jgi:drug/metabolite transporter (DMT)-like permease
VHVALLAPFSYAVAGVYAKKVSLNATPLALAMGQQFAARILLFPVAALTLPASLPSVSVVSAVLALALLSTAIGYLIFYQLIERIGATNTLSVTLLVPIFGMVWGAIILGEPISLIQIVGLIIILASLILVTNITFGKTQH